MAMAEPLEEHPNRVVVAAFDVDGTLTTRDCVVPFLRLTAGLPAVIGALARRPFATLGAVLRRDRDALKALAVRSLAGRSWGELLTLGEAFAHQVIRARLRPDTTTRLAWHREQGHRIVLVSASLRPYLVPLGLHLGVDAVLCCELELADGVVTGRLDGPNCRGPEKVRRLQQWLGSQGLAERAEVWAYGDSRGDHELLAAAARGFFVKDLVVPAQPGERSG